MTKGRQVKMKKKVVHVGVRMLGIVLAKCSTRTSRFWECRWPDAKKKNERWCKKCVRGK